MNVDPDRHATDRIKLAKTCSCGAQTALRSQSWHNGFLVSNVWVCPLCGAILYEWSKDTGMVMPRDPAQKPRGFAGLPSPSMIARSIAAGVGSNPTISGVLADVDSRRSAGHEKSTAPDDVVGDSPDEATQPTTAPEPHASSADTSGVDSRRDQPAPKATPECGSDLRVSTSGKTECPQKTDSEENRTTKGPKQMGLF